MAKTSQKRLLKAGLNGLRVNQSQMESLYFVGVSGIKLVSNVSNERLWLGLLDKGESSVESWHNLTISLLRERKVFDLVIIAHFRLINSNTVTIKIDSFEKPSLSDCQ